MSDRQRIEEQLERSSLGSPAAKAARRTIPTSYAERVVAMAERQRREVNKPRPKRLGGNDPVGTCTQGVIVQPDDDEPHQTGKALPSRGSEIEEPRCLETTEHKR